MRRPGSRDASFASVIEHLLFGNGLRCGIASRPDNVFADAACLLSRSTASKLRSVNFFANQRPPYRDVELRVRCTSPDFDPLLAAEVSISFRDGNSWHRGCFAASLVSPHASLRCPLVQRGRRLCSRSVLRSRRSSERTSRPLELKQIERRDRGGRGFCGVLDSDRFSEPRSPREPIEGRPSVRVEHQVASPSRTSSGSSFSGGIAENEFAAALPVFEHCDYAFVAAS